MIPWWGDTGWNQCLCFGGGNKHYLTLEHRSTRSCSETALWSNFFQVGKPGLPFKTALWKPLEVGRSGLLPGHNAQFYLLVGLGSHSDCHLESPFQVGRPVLQLEVHTEYYVHGINSWRGH